MSNYSIPDTIIPHDTPDAKHASGQTLFGRLARFSVRRRRPIMLAWLILTVAAAPLAIGVSSALSGAGWEAQGSIAQTVRDELRADFPMVGAESAIVVVHQKNSFRRRLQRCRCRRCCVNARSWWRGCRWHGRSIHDAA